MANEEAIERHAQAAVAPVELHDHYDMDEPEDNDVDPVRMEEYQRIKAIAIRQIRKLQYAQEESTECILTVIFVMFL